MSIYELKIKVYLMQDIGYKNSYEKIAYVIDSGFLQDDNFGAFHNTNGYKNYCFSSFYPIEEDGVYKKDNIYTITLRTIDIEISKYIYNIKNHFTDEIKILNIDVKEFRNKEIQKLYSITPNIIKTDQGYWRGSLSIEDYENRVKINLIKKYNNFYNEKIDEDFQFVIAIVFHNKKPIGVSYKNKTLLGDKIDITISDDEISQKLAYMALGTGILEMNARGFGFVNAKFY